MKGRAANKHVIVDYTTLYTGEFLINYKTIFRDSAATKYVIAPIIVFCSSELHVVIIANFHLVNPWVMKVCFWVRFLLSKNSLLQSVEIFIPFLEY